MAVLKAGSRLPWVGLGAAVWVQIAAGNAYTFPLYSPSLKSVLGFTQQQLTILGVANDIGENVGILPGIACNKLPPWVVLLIGLCLSFFGYGVLWLAVSQTIQSLPYWVVANVKKTIETVQGSNVYPATQQMLIYQGKVLKDETTLEEQNVAKNSFLVIMLTKIKGRSSTMSGSPTTTVETLDRAGREVIHNLHVSKKELHLVENVICFG